MHQRIFQKIMLLIAIAFTSALSSHSQVMPQIGGNYYIAAQTWDGSKYVERFLYLGANNYVYQTQDLTTASIWSALAPANGSGMALRTKGKFLMRGGISSSSWGTIVAEPTITISDPPTGSMTLKSTVRNYAYYIIAPNAGTEFTAVNAANEASYQPKTSLYTPYFRFYDASAPMLSVKECNVEGSPMAVSAAYLLTPDGKNPICGNLWPMQDGSLTIDADSYNHLFYTFMGFKLDGSDQLLPKVSTSELSGNTNVTAVFSTNSLDGETFTFISSSPQWYANQNVYKAIYFDPEDNLLKWKTYNPIDQAFYFKAHGTFDNLKFEPLSGPGLFITGANSPVDSEGARVELRPLGAGDYSLLVGDQNLYAYGHNNGRGVEGTLTSAAGTSGSVAAWWVQSANDQAAEQARYQQALANEAALVAEGERQNARSALLDAIRAVTVGSAMGQVPQDAYDMAMATYQNNSLSTTDYRNAVTLLYSSCNVPGVGTFWRIINAGNAGQVIYVGQDNALKHIANRASLYQMWEVVAADPEEPTHLALRNLGSGTYLYTQTQSSNSPTTTTDEEVFVGFNAVTPGIFTIQNLTKPAPNIYFCISPYGPAIITGTGGNWRLQEVSPIDIDNLSQAEGARAETRQALLELADNATTLSTTLGAIGYYETLTSAISAARAVYADQSKLITEYAAAIEALQNAITNATVIAPENDTLYIICDHNGRIAMQHEGNQATMSEYDDTDLDHFWRVEYNGAEGSDILPWQQRYTLSSVDGENTVLSVLLTLKGNNEYTVEIEGDDAWNAAYANTLLSFHKASVGEDKGYLVDGETYRIRNAATGRMLVRSEQWPARVAVADADDTCTDLNQFWRVEKQKGADRYQLHNVESNRHIEEQLSAGTQLVAAFTPGTWHLSPAGNSGEYKLLTTMAPVTQLAIGYDGDKAVAVSETAEGNVWTFERATPKESEPQRYNVYKLLNRNVTETVAGAEDYLYANLTKASHSYSSPSPLDEDYMRWLLVDREYLDSNGNPIIDTEGDTVRMVALRNVNTALYINPPMAVSPTPYYFEMRSYRADNGNKYTVLKDPATGNYLTPRTNRDELILYTVVSDRYPQWTLIKESFTLTESDIMDNTDRMFGYSAPEDGAVMRIFSPYNSCLDDYYKQRILQHKTYDEDRYAQLWRLHRNEETGLYKLENIYTGAFVMNSNTAGGNISTTADASQAGEFAIAANKSITSGRYYNILDARLGIGLRSSSTNISTGAVTVDDVPASSEWRFKADNHTDEEYLAMREKYNESLNITGNEAKYDAILAAIFSDRAYTTLRADITVEEIEAAVAQLPDMLADMVRKIYTDTWAMGKSGNCWEKIFRIQDYPVTSNSNWMSGQTYVGYSYSQLNEPTGILGRTGDIVAVMVDELPQQEASLRLEMVEGLNRSGTQVTLKKGLNLIPVSEDCNLFIFYQVTGTGSDHGVTDNEKYYLSQYPDIRIHIEGGEVYGCIDRTRGMANTREGANKMWADMLADGLITNGPMAQIKGRSIMLNFNSASVVKGCPERIGEVIDIWDFIIEKEQWLMGLRDKDGNVISDYIPHLKERWNNRWLAYERTGGYMNANGGGAQYNTGTIETIVNFNQLSQGNAHWGPAHEHGHDHQPLINMCGMTEVSNNLFSNVACYEFGAIVSRGSSLPDAGKVYADGGHWFDNNIWTLAQMYYKLYLYYHVAGNKPTFYPEVFARMNKNRLLHSASVAVPADRDYLQFAVVCSEVAGEDLSEFFEAYGMLRPIAPEYSLCGESGFEMFGGQYCRIVGDYSTYHVYTTPEMIAQAKAKMAACGRKNGSIMFIEDRVRQQPATHEWAKPGQMRANRGDGGIVGAYGNVGQWDDFSPEAKGRYARDYQLTKEWSARGVTLHVSGSGAVGYKIYSPDGEMVYFSAFNDILIPAKILEKYDLADLVLVVAQADGTSVELACDEDRLFTLTTYRNGSTDGLQSSSTGRFEPELLGNDICVVAPSASVAVEEFAFRGTPNIVLKHDDDTHTAERLEIKDKTNFYLPAQVEAQNVTYTRENTGGWNSVCLPMPLSAADLGDDCQIYTLKTLVQEADSYVLTLKRKDMVDAGEPCFVWCPEGVDAWVIEMDDAVASTQLQTADSDDGMIQLCGSFVNAQIGEGKYKLNSDGSAFGRTSSSGSVTAFRSYLDSSASMPKQLRLRIDNESTEGVENVILDKNLAPGLYYDLSGRQIPAPIKGQPYILNGHVCVDR